jgi:tRNA A-37 threonylcarbamoyl transferase component Bud32
VDLQQALARRVREVEESRHREEDLRMKLEALGGWLGTKGVPLSESLSSISNLAQEVAHAVGADGILIYVVQDDKLVPITGEDESPFVWPALIDSVRQSGEMLQIPGYLLLPLRTPSGSTLGVLVAHGLGRSGLLHAELNLLKLLCRETASGLELLRLRKDLEKIRLEREREGALRIHEETEKLGVCPGCMRCYEHGKRKCPEDGSLLQVLPDVPFEVAGRYRFERRLGVGGMGMIFRAFDSQLNRKVALKVVRLRQSLMDAETNRRRFVAETQILAGINHPGIVTLHDSGELSSGTMYIVTELLRGLDLEKVLSLYGPGTPEQVATLITEAGLALNAAHHLGLVHRDVKPANIFVLPERPGFRAKLIDFGLARSETSHRLTQESCVVGTPRYMAPEIFKGSEGTTRSDLYSLVAVAYEALTDSPVVKGTQIGDVVLEVLTMDPEPISAFLGPQAQPLDSLFYQGLAKDPDLRPSSVLEWVTEVVNRLEGVSPRFHGWPEFQAYSGPIRLNGENGEGHPAAKDAREKHVSIEPAGTGVPPDVKRVGPRGQAS